MKKLLKEPLLHFLVLGGLLFAGHRLMNRREGPDTGRIVVTQGQIENFHSAFTRVWQRPPSPDELNGLIQDHVREEVFAREAVALGLERDDTLIRRRLRQKMEFIANDLAVPAAPDDAELQAYLAAHAEAFRIEPRFTFRQVFLNPSRHGGAVNEEAGRLLATLNEGDARDFPSLGDATLLSPALADASASEVNRMFGDEFARQLSALPAGRWQGPVTSAYGVHLVLVEHRTEGRMPELAEVHDQVAVEWADARRRADNEKFYQTLLKRYTVTFELPKPAPHSQAVTAQVEP